MALTEQQKSFFKNESSDFWPFLQQTDVERDSLLLSMEKQFENIGVYSVGPWFGKLLNLLVRFGQVRSALEFGTATGYSAVWIARGLESDGRLVAIERDIRLAEVARENIARAGLCGQVEVKVGDARDVVPTLEGPFDLIFVDCAHLEALDASRELLRRGALFVCDNVGFRNKGDFNQRLMASPHLETLYLQCYLKGRIPENTAFSVSIRR